MQSLQVLPPDLPQPVDDGVCKHLTGMDLPSCLLSSTQGGLVDLAQIKGWLVVYYYPMTGQPNVPLPDQWDAIPGARGCTPQSCAFRDHHAEFSTFHATVFGLSTQSTTYQQEAAQRLHLPFPLLSDIDYAFTNPLQLPTFLVANLRLNKRVTLIAKDGIIQHYFYPVFPPDKNADEVLSWLKLNV